MNRSRHMRIVQAILALVATVFGLVTIIAGARVLFGFHPGYIVFWPLLVYNTSMGVVYVAAGAIAWRNVERGKYAAVAIFVLNVLVSGTIGYLYMTGSSVAIESLRAMTFRTVVWLLLLLGLAWVGRRNALSGRQDS